MSDDQIIFTLDINDTAFQSALARAKGGLRSLTESAEKMNDAGSKDEAERSLKNLEAALSRANDKYDGLIAKMREASIEAGRQKDLVGASSRRLLEVSDAPGGGDPTEKMEIAKQLEESRKSLADQISAYERADAKARKLLSTISEIAGATEKASMLGDRPDIGPISGKDPGDIAKQIAAYNNLKVAGEEAGRAFAMMGVENLRLTAEVQRFNFQSDVQRESIKEISGAWQNGSKELKDFEKNLVSVVSAEKDMERLTNGLSGSIESFNEDFDELSASLSTFEARSEQVNASVAESVNRYQQGEAGLRAFDAALKDVIRSQVASENATEQAAAAVRFLGGARGEVINLIEAIGQQTSASRRNNEMIERSADASREASAEFARFDAVLRQTVETDNRAQRERLESIATFNRQRQVVEATVDVLQDAAPATTELSRATQQLNAAQERNAALMRSVTPSVMQQSMDDDLTRRIQDAYDATPRRQRLSRSDAEAALHAGGNIPAAPGPGTFRQADEALQRVQGKIGKYIESLKNAFGLTGRFFSGLTSGAKSFLSLPMAPVVKMVQGMNAMSFAAWKLTSGLNTLKMGWDQLFDTMQRGAEFEKIKYTFDTITRGAGASMSKLREQTGGIINDKDLMKMTTFANQAKMNAKDIEMIMSRVGGAVAISGRDSTEVLQRMVMGISKREKEIMDELTIHMPNAAKIWRDAAKALNISVSELTEGQKQRAYINTFEIMSKNLEAVGKKIPASLNKVEQFSARMTNNIDEFSSKIMKIATESGITDRVESMFKSLTDGVTDFLSNPDAKVFLEQTWESLGNLGKALGSVLQALAPALSAVNPLITILAGAIKGLTPLFALAVEYASKLTLVLGYGLTRVIGGFASGMSKITGLLGDNRLSSGLGELSSAMNEAGDMIVKMGEVSIDADKNIKTLARDQKALEATTEGVHAEFRTAARNALEYKQAIDGVNKALQQTAIATAAASSGAQKVGDKMQAGIDVMKAGAGALLQPGAFGNVLQGSKEMREDLRQRMVWAMTSQLKPEDISQTEIDKIIAEDEAYQRSQGAKGDIISMSREDAANIRLNDIRRKGDFTLEEQNKALERLMEEASTGKLRAGSGASRSIIDPEGKSFITTDAKAITDYYKGLVEAFNDSNADLRTVAGMANSINRADSAEIEEMLAKQREQIEINIPYAMKSGRKLEDAIGDRNPLLPGADIEYQRGMDRTGVMNMVDVLSLDPSAPPTAKGYDKWNQEAVDTNIKAFESYRVQLTDQYGAVLDDIAAVEEAMARLDEMAPQMLMSSAGSANYYAQREAMSAQIGLLSTSKDQISSEIKTAIEIRDELYKRKKPPSGGRKKEPKMILWELIGVSDDAMSEAADVLDGHAAYLTRRFSGELAQATAGAISRGLKEDIKGHMPQIEAAAERAMELSTQALMKANMAATPEEMLKMLDISAAMQQSVVDSGFIEMHPDTAKINAKFAADNKFADVIRQDAEVSIALNEMAKDSLNDLEKSKKDLRWAQMAAFNEDKKFLEGSGIDLGGERMQFSALDVPEHVMKKNLDPGAAIKSEQIDEKISDIRKKLDDDVKALFDKAREGGGTDAIQGTRFTMEAEAETRINQLLLEKSQLSMAAQRAAITEHVGIIKGIMETAQTDISTLFGESTGFALGETLGTAFNASLTMAEDWTASMIGLVEDMTSQIGQSLAQMGSALTEAYTGSKILGGMTGGLIGGFFKGLMSLFKTKDSRDEEKAREAQREMRREKTKRGDEFNVTFVIQGQPITQAGARQNAEQFKSFLRGGGKIGSL